MRLSQNTEYAVVGALIVYTVFLSPSMFAVRRFMGSAIGSVLGLAAVYWVAKTVSVPLALIVLAVVIRCSSGMVREFMDCTECPPDYAYDTASKMCKKDGAGDVPPSCAAPKGMDMPPTPTPTSSTPPA